MNHLLQNCIDSQKALVAANAEIAELRTQLAAFRIELQQKNAIVAVQGAQLAAALKGRTMSCICGGEAQLKKAEERHRLELTLRAGRVDFLVETPKEHRVHGQHAAFASGVETAYRGWVRSNPYEFHTAQFRAWDKGFQMGAVKFCEDFGSADARAKEKP